MRCLILSRGLDQRTRRGPEPQPYSDSTILSLICTTDRKKADFLNFRADRKVLVYNVSCYLSEVIHPCFICVVSSPTVTCKSAAVYLCCIYVMALAQAREKSQISI